MDKPPKIGQKALNELIDMMNNGDSPLSKKVRRIQKEAQKNVMQMFSVDGGKSKNNDNDSE